MSEKDPFQGLNDHFRREAREQFRSPVTVGKVLSLAPLKVRADGLDLTGEDIYMAEHLLPGWQETLTGLSWPLTADLPEAIFSGTCEVGGMQGKAVVTRPAETVKGRTAKTAGVTHGRAVKAGDLVLMTRSEDGQAYYICERLVNMNGVSIPSDPAPDGDGGAKSAAGP